MNLNQKKLQFLGIYGILRETIKLIATAKTIFAKITLAFILPLSLLIFFTRSQIPNPWSIQSLPYDFALFCLSAVFFLLSTASAVFAAACTFADREVSFYQLIRVAPNVCKQHLTTLLCLIVDFFAFNFITLTAITLICILIPLLLNYNLFEFLTQLLVSMLSVEIFYFSLIWQISSVVSVFEPDSYGFEAIARSKELIKGRMAMTSAILLILIGFCFGGIWFVVVVVVESGLVREGILGIVWICSFLMFLLIGTVLYLVCKSYHGQSLEKLELSAHLQGYFPVDYEASKVEDDDHLHKTVAV